MTTKHKFIGYFVGAIFVGVFGTHTCLAARQERQFMQVCGQNYAQDKCEEVWQGSDQQLTPALRWVQH